MKKYKLGIALSGGGSRGFTHLGVLHALNEKGIYPDIISGASAGSIVGAIYASGMKPYDIFEYFRKKKVIEFTKFHLPKNGLFNFDNLEAILQKIIKGETFEELKMPLYICISNFNNGKAEYVNSGKLHIIIKASCSIPVLVPPVKIGNKYYVDGGLVDNLPVKPLVGKCKKIIGVNISPYQEIEKIDSLFKVAVRTFQISLNNNIRYNKNKCDIYLEPKDIIKYNMFEIKNSSKLFELGYDIGKNIDIKALT